MKKLLLSLMIATAAGSALAEVSQVTFGIQNGWAYTPLMAMKEQKLVEKHAEKAGIKVTPEYKNLGSPGVIRDGMLAGQVQYGAVGVPTLITLADKTAGEWKALGNIVSLPMFLNTTEKVASICDLKGKIAVPTVKSSVQAVALQKMAQAECGSPFKLDAQTVSMTHPDGLVNLKNAAEGKPSPITSHLTSPPFSFLETEFSGVKTLASSSDAKYFGKSSFILLVGSQKFASENPKVQKAVADAFAEAQAWVDANRAQAASLYLSSEKTNEDAMDVIKQMSRADVSFGVAPDGIGKYSSFMKEVGTVKREMDWKFLSFPNLHGTKGS